MNKKILFFSSTDFGARLLETLIDSNFELVGVVTRTDKIRARGNKVISTPVKTIALNNNVEVFERDFIDETDKEWIENLNPDLFVVVAYGALIPQKILDLAKIAPINIHASILPKYRGASPIESVIMNGEKKTGISYMHMIKSLDAGDLYKIYDLDILENENFDSLNERLCKLSSETLINTLDLIVNGDLIKKPQGENPTYVGKILKTDCKIDFNNKSVVIKNKINALDSHIGAYGIIDGQRYKLYSAEVSGYKIEPGLIVTNDHEIFIGSQDGSVKINKIQAPGKKIMLAKDFLRGNKIEGKF